MGFWFRYRLSAALAGMLLLLGGGQAARPIQAKAPPKPVKYLVSVRVEGRITPGSVRPGTVGQALRCLGVRLGPEDVVIPAAGTRVSPGEAITVVRVRSEIRRNLVPISYPTETRQDPGLIRGERTVLQAGRDGQGLVSYRVVYADGVEVQNQVLGEKVVTPPVPEVIGVGTAEPVVVSRGGDYRYSREISMLATGYWADPAWSNGRTATGRPAVHGVVAVDPRVIPLGARLYIPGYGLAVAGDTGGAIRGDRVDLCFNTGWAADDWGVRWVKVYVLE